MKTDRKNDLINIDEICQLTSEMYSLDYAVNKPTKKELYESKRAILSMEYSSMFDEVSAARTLEERLQIADRMKLKLEEMTSVHQEYLRDE